MRAAAGIVLLGLLLAPHAGAQGTADGVEFVVGGEPGVRVAIDGTDVATARSPGTAIEVQPDTPIVLSLILAAPPNTMWELGAMRASLLLRGAESKGLGTSQALDATIPPGFTVFINRTVDLAPLRPVGAGLFMMRVVLDDENGTVLYAQDFQVHVQGHAILSVAGATATVATLATGYGLWSILNDLREFKKARDRHRAREKERPRLAKLAKLADAAIALEDGLEGAVDVAGDASSRAERLSRRRPLAWAATGLGLGSVTISWASFFGYIALDVGTLLVAAMGTAAVFLTSALLLIVLVKRLKDKHAARVVRIPVQGPPEAVAAPLPATPPAESPGAPAPEESGPLVPEIRNP